jgi:hypothetical protein
VIFAVLVPRIPHITKIKSNIEEEWTNEKWNNILE